MKKQDNRLCTLILRFGDWDLEIMLKEVIS